MTPRQKFLKWIYPIFTAFKKRSGKTGRVVNTSKKAPTVPLYTLSFQLNTGETISFEQMKGKKILIVNTASDCGFTGQYAELQKLYADRKHAVEVIGFPANDFKEQEKGSDEEIARFCSVNYGVSFPLAKKSSVIKSPNQNTVFRWLSDKQMNGWNDQAPSWNFSKYLISEDGLLLGYFDPAVSPLQTEFLEILDK
ncbi:MAG TPA: glutathione peroxidase [Flavisolibacter sp.]|nr:glutathione peroxidase [Flavisolibacter sp.]